VAAGLDGSGGLGLLGVNIVWFYSEQPLQALTCRNIILGYVQRNNSLGCGGVIGGWSLHVWMQQVLARLVLCVRNFFPPAVKLPSCVLAWYPDVDSTLWNSARTLCAPC